MGHWGVKSYENDEAADALDAAFARVHGDLYDDLMDDANPLTPDQVQEKLATAETLAAALAALEHEVNADSAEPPSDPEVWDEVARLAYVGIVVRHVELKVAPPPEARERAIRWLRDEAIEWDEATERRLRRDRELRSLESP